MKHNNPFKQFAKDCKPHFSKEVLDNYRILDPIQLSPKDVANRIARSMMR